MTAATAPAAPRVPLVRLDPGPEVRDEMLAAVGRIARDGAFTLGEEVAAFEAEFAAYCETAHAVGVSSGTDALALALRALGIGHGDEVVVPANSFVASAEAVVLAGGVPRLVDVDPVSGLLTADLVAAALGPRTRAVIVVHLFGATADVDAIAAVARAHGVAVVEDAAQAHGARVHGRRAGSAGDVGCFSFYPTKNLGGWGDGGAVVTADAELADRVRLLRCHGERPRYHHRVAGTTSRLDAVQAAVLRIALRRLDAANDRRRAVARALADALAGGPLELPAPPSAGDHVFHLFVVRSGARDALRAHLAAEGIASAVHYPVPIHRTEAFAGASTGRLPVVESLAGRICSLPLWPGMTDDDVALIAAAVHDFDPAEAWKPTA